MITISKDQVQHQSAANVVVSDRLASFKAVEDAQCEHFSIVTGAGPESVKQEPFSGVNTMIANVKNLILGSYHAIRHKHLPRYLAECSYRFNRRFQLDTTIRYHAAEICIGGIENTTHADKVYS